MKPDQYDYIIVGAGLCGLSLARELSKKNKKILVLEKGTYVRKLGAIPYLINVYDKAALSRSKQGVIIYRAFGVGGTSLVCCGNAVEPSKNEIARLGIDITKELQETKKDCKVSTTSFPIGRASLKIMEAANSLGYDMQIMPKFGALSKCVACGDCELGCRHGAKWTALEFLWDANKSNITIVPHVTVEKVISTAGKVRGVVGKSFLFKKRTFFADRVILAAGGIGTPIILQRSGVDAGNNLFVDLFNMTYGFNKSFNQHHELAMSVVCTKFHEKEGFVLSPFMDNLIGLFSTIGMEDIWKTLKFRRLLGIMTKIDDENIGRVHQDGAIDKEPTAKDLEKLRKGNDIARQILGQCGVEPATIFVTKPHGAHPGGTAVIGSVVDKNLETRIKGLFVCDASVLPFAPGIPPMLMLIALAKWFAKI